MNNEIMMQAVAAAVLGSVDKDTLLVEIRKRGLELVGPSLLGIDVLDHVDDATLIKEATARNLMIDVSKLDRDVVVKWLTGEATGNDRREVADNLPSKTLADSLVDGGNASLVLENADDDDLWEAISDKDWIVQRNVDDLDQEALLDSIDEGTKDEMCEQWWKDSKDQLLSECDDGELWEAIDNKDQFKGEANVEAVERILTDCDTDGLIKALEVIGRRLRGW